MFLFISDDLELKKKLKYLCINQRVKTRSNLEIDKGYLKIIPSGNTSNDIVADIRNFDNLRSIFKITGEGKIGINTETPSEYLDVFGKTKTENLQVTSGAIDGYFLQSDANGNTIWSNLNYNYQESGIPLFFVRCATNFNLDNVSYNNGFFGSGATITLIGSGIVPEIDGVSPILDDFVLIKDQTNKIQNGIYVVTDEGSLSTPYVLTRIELYDETGEIFPSQVNVNEGVKNINKYFIQDTVNPIIGIDDIIYSVGRNIDAINSPVIFIHNIINSPLPNLPIYTPTALLSGFPGYVATLEATINGDFPIVNGLNPQVNQRVFINAEANEAYNGYYYIVNKGSASTKYKLQRIFYQNWQLYPKLFYIFETGSTEYKNLYTSKYNIESVNVGTDPIKLETSIVNSITGGTLSGTTLILQTGDINIELSGLTNNIWSSSTGSNSIIANNGTGNLASGNFSIAAGYGNTVTRPYSSIIGGQNNSATTNYHIFIGGGYANLASGFRSSIVGGGNNNTGGDFSFIGGGLQNSATTNYASIVGGTQNLAFGSHSFIGGGRNNLATTKYATVVGGRGNLASGNYSFVGNGRNNLASGAHSSIVGGSGNTVSGTRSVVLGGRDIVASSHDTAYVPNLNINTTPSNDNALNQILARAIDGTVKYKDINSFTDMTVTGGTYDITTGIVTFFNNSGGTFQVTGFTSGMTDSYTTTAYTVGNVIRFDNNIQGSNFYNVDLSSIVTSANTLSQVLATGNVVSTGQTINGFYGSQIDFEYNNQSAIGLTTDNGSYGESWLFIDKGGVEMLTQMGGFANYSSDSYNISNTGTTSMWARKEVFDGTQFAVLLSAQRDKELINLNQNTAGLYIFNNNELNQSIGSFSGDGAATFLSTENSTINSGVTGSVIIGGVGITATTNNTTYVPHLNIGLIQTGTSVYNLGIDSSGNVVTGTTKFTGNTSGESILDLYVSNIHSSSPLNINPLDEGNIYFGSNSALTIDLSTEQVGIGTPTPTSKLDVRGNITVGYGLGSTPRLFFRPTDDSLQPFIEHTLGSGFTYNTKSDEGHRFSDGGTGNTFVFFDGFNNSVKIGEDSTPNAKLHVTNLGSLDSFLIEDSANPDSTPFIINNSGSVGIGTASPLEMLHIVDGDLRIDRYNNNSPTFSFFKYRGTSSLPLNVQNNNLIGKITTAGYNGSALTETRASIEFKATQNWTTTDNGTSIQFNTTENGTITNSERVKIDHNGNMGIGISVPTEKLEVSGKTKTENLQITSGATDGYVLTSDSSGNTSWKPTTSAASNLFSYYNFI